MIDLMNKLSYDPLKELISITQTGSQVMLLVVHPSLPVNSVKELIAYEAVSRNGIFAPAQTPRPIIDKIHSEVVKALAASYVREKLMVMVSDPATSTPEALLAFIKLELARWGTVIRENKIRTG